MRYGSVCSGIEAASVAWHPLGWKAAWLAEIEPFPCAVLAHHYPEVTNLGDMTKIAAMVMVGNVEAPDVLVGGTPCQAFSVAGMREGLNDPRGELTIKYVELANAVDDIRAKAGKPPAIVVWENVPGVLSDKGNAFGCFLGALAGEDCALESAGGKWSDAGCVYGPQRTIAWRIFDAQYFGLAQRRRRVFAVASARKDFDPCAVLFERDSMRRDTAPSREARQDAARGFTAGPSGVGFADIAPTLDCRAKNGPVQNQIGMGVLEPLIPALTQCLTTGTPCLDANSPAPALLTAHQVRRLTPTECERLQGFPMIFEKLRIDVCFDHQSTDVRVALKCLRSQSSVWSAEEERLMRSATTADADSSTFQANREPHVALHVRLHSEDELLEVRSQGKLLWPANGVESQSKSAPLMLDANTVQELAQLLRDLVKTAHSGKVASLPSIRLSLVDANGGKSAEKSTQETEVCADAVVSDQKAEKAKYTTSSLGLATPICDSKAAILCCCVLRATSGFIPSETSTGSFSVELTVDTPYTAIPWRNKPTKDCPDGPRYKALGNSKAVPVVRWIGARINRQLSKEY